MKRTTILLTVAVTALAAFAQEAPLMVTHGRAGLLSQDGRKAQTQFEVGEIKGKEGSTLTVGGFDFNQEKNEKGRRVEIGMRKAMAVKFDGNKARFEGKAVLVFWTEKGPKKVEGAALVEVADRKKADAEGDLDLFHVHFKAKEGDMNFDFAGAAKRGDIFVGERKRRA